MPTQPAPAREPRRPRRPTRPRRLARVRSSAGLILLDVLFGMVLFALLAATAVQEYGLQRTRSYQTTTASDARQIGTTVQAALATEPDLPADKAAFAALLADPDNPLGVNLTDGNTLGGYETLPDGGFRACVVRLRGGTPVAWSVFDSDTGLVRAGRVPAAVPALCEQADAPPPPPPPPPPTYVDTVLADSPVAYWRLGEAAGPSMVDASGNGRNGTYSGAATWNTAGLVAGDADKAVSFSNGAGSVPAGAWSSPGAAFTAEALFKPGRLTGHNMILGHVDYSAVVSSAYYSFHLRWTNNKLHAGLGTTVGGYTEQAVGPVLTVGRTYHVAMTWDGALVRIYLDGVQVDSFAKSGTLWGAASAAVTVGSDASSVARATGDIDEVAFYGSALSAARIAAHYAAGIASP